MISSTCHLLSLNVRGLRNTNKRGQIIKWCKQQKANIIFLQETYWTEKLEKVIISERRGKCFFSHGTNHSCGVAILIDGNLNITVNKIDSQNDGRRLLLHVTIGNNNFILVNIYAPTKNNEKARFFYESDQMD